MALIRVLTLRVCPALEHRGMSGPVDSIPVSDARTTATATRPPDAGIERDPLGTVADRARAYASQTTSVATPVRRHRGELERRPESSRYRGRVTKTSARGASTQRNRARPAATMTSAARIDRSRLGRNMRIHEKQTLTRSRTTGRGGPIPSRRQRFPSSTDDSSPLHAGAPPMADRSPVVAEKTPSVTASSRSAMDSTGSTIVAETVSTTNAPARPPTIDRPFVVNAGTGSVLPDVMPSVSVTIDEHRPPEPSGSTPILARSEVTTPMIPPSVSAHVDSVGAPTLARTSEPLGTVASDGTPSEVRAIFGSSSDPASTGGPTPSDATVATLTGTSVNYMSSDTDPTNCGAWASNETPQAVSPAAHVGAPTAPVSASIAESPTNISPPPIPSTSAAVDLPSTTPVGSFVSTAPSDIESPVSLTETSASGSMTVEPLATSSSLVIAPPSTTSPLVMAQPPTTSPLVMAPPPTTSSITTTAPSTSSTFVMAPPPPLLFAEPAVPSPVIASHAAILPSGAILLSPNLVPPPARGANGLVGVSKDPPERAVERPKSRTAVAIDPVSLPPLVNRTPASVPVSFVYAIRDGGSQLWRGPDGVEYWEDGRLDSTTHGAVYDRPPGKRGAIRLKVVLDKRTDRTSAPGPSSGPSAVSHPGPPTTPSTSAKLADASSTNEDTRAAVSVLSPDATTSHVSVGSVLEPLIISATSLPVNLAAVAASFDTDMRGMAMGAESHDAEESVGATAGSIRSG